MTEWLQMGFDPGTLKHRKLVLEKVAKYEPSSLLDVGCATGPDIALLKLKYPDIEITGFDLDPVNVEQAQHLDALVYQGDVYDELPGIPDKKHDVVLSNGVMMYVERKCIRELIRIAKKAVILSERDPDQNILHYIREEIHIEPIITKVTEATRDSWKNDGYIYELCLNN